MGVRNENLHINQTDSPVRGSNVRVTVYRIKRNQPHLVGSCDRHTSSWKGAHGEAVAIIHVLDGLRYHLTPTGGIDTFRLRGELMPADKYEDFGHRRDAVRLFECSRAMQ